MRTYNEIYLAARNLLRNGGDEDHSTNAKLLTAAAAGKTVQELIRDLRLYTTNDINLKVIEFVKRKLNDEPIAYITGSWEFYGLPIAVTPDVLIPRQDTELIVETAKEFLNGKKMDARILDLCCGSGCISCAIGHELPATRFVDIDISKKALDVCRKNISINGLNSRIICMQADVLKSPPIGIGSFDLIVSNPPYVSSDELNSLEPSVRNFEPMIALDGGSDGLKFYRAIIKQWRSQLNKKGVIIFEVGENQAPLVSEMLQNAGFSETGTRKDLSGTDRVVFGIQ